jgi:hypothetical protein
MQRISSSKLQLQFAKAKEAEGRWAEAATAYEAAGDMDAVVRLCLERLNQPQRAYAIVRKTQSVEAANQLSRFCLQTQDFQVRGWRGSERRGGTALRAGAWPWRGIAALVLLLSCRATVDCPSPLSLADRSRAGASTLCSLLSLSLSSSAAGPSPPLPSAAQGAVEFLLMAGQMDQAFDIAMGHNEMDTFARIVAASAKPVRRPCWCPQLGASP